MADVVQFKNGDQLTGSVTHESDQSIQMETLYGETLSFPKKDIQTINRTSDRPPPLPLASDSTPVITTNWTASGRVNTSAVFKRGNTVKDDLEIDGLLVVENKKHRVTLEGEITVESRNNDKQETESELSGRYDHFISKKTYLTSSVTFKKDDASGLKSRQLIGQGVGYQFFDSKRISLSAEILPVYVNEEFDATPTDRYWAIYTMSQLDWELIQDGLIYFFSTEAAQSFSDQETFFLEGSTGLRMPLWAHFLLTAEVKFEHQNPVPEGIDENDLTYRLKLGYEW